MSSSAFTDELRQSNTTLTPIDVIYDNSPTLYCSRQEVENFTVNPETKEGSFQAQGYYAVQDDQLPVNLQFFLYEGEKITHYKVEVQKKITLEEVEQEGFEDADLGQHPAFGEDDDQGQHPTFGEDDEYPGCRIVLFPEYIFQVFFKVLETNPVERKTTISEQTIQTYPLTQEKSQEESDDLIAKILRDMNK